MVDDIADAMREGSLDLAVRKVPDEAVDSLLVAGDRAGCDAALGAYTGVLDEVVLADATSVGASIDHRNSDGGAGLRSLLSLAPDN